MNRLVMYCLYRPLGEGGKLEFEVIFIYEEALSNAWFLFNNITNKLICLLSKWIDLSFIEYRPLGGG